MGAARGAVQRAEHLGVSFFSEKQKLALCFLGDLMDALDKGAGEISHLEARVQGSERPHPLLGRTADAVRAQKEHRMSELIAFFGGKRSPLLVYCGDPLRLKVGKKDGVVDQLTEGQKPCGARLLAERCHHRLGGAAHTGAEACVFGKYDPHSALPSGSAEGVYPPSSQTRRKTVSAAVR